MHTSFSVAVAYVTVPPAVPGRRFAVDIYYTKAPEANYVEAAVLAVLQVEIAVVHGGLLALGFTRSFPPLHRSTSLRQRPATFSSL